MENGIMAVNRQLRDKNCILYVKVPFQNGKESPINDGSSSCTDSSSGILPNSLRETVLENMRGNKNVIIEAADEVIREKLDNSESFANRIYCSVKEKVDKSMAEQNPVKKIPLYNEVYNHWRFLKSSHCPLLEREDLFSATKDYFLSETDRPFVVIGEDGVGKTSAIVKIIRDVNTAICNGDLTMRTAIVFRFIGETQITTARQFLYNLCQHLVILMGKDENEIPTDYKQLKYFFSELLLSGEFGGMLIILLDSVDTLQDNHNLEWLPIKIAVNVKLVVSCSSTSQTNCTSFLDRCKDRVHNLGQLNAADCERIFRSMISSSWRSVTYEQMSIVKDAFQCCSLPIFLSMAIEEAKRWHSYDKLKFCNLGENVKENISKFFDRVDKDHGTLLASHFIGYLTAARLGLSESELLDIMSLDDALLDHVMNGTETSIRRMPSYLMVRLLHDLDPFITEREVDGILVLSWKHMQFHNAATERYLKNENFKEILYSNISDYFLGTWSGSKRKPYRSTKNKALQNQLEDMEACRYVYEQPNHFGSIEAITIYNQRKFRHLTCSLSKSNRIEELKKHALCNLDYIFHKIKSSTIQELLSDYEYVQDREIKLVAEALKLAAPTIEKGIGCLGAELSGRLMQHTKYHNQIRELVYFCDLYSQRNCPLVPNCQCYNTPGGVLQYKFNAESASNISFHQSPIGIFLTAKTFGFHSLRTWEISKGDPLPEIAMPFGQIHATRDGNFLNVFCNDGTVKIFRSDCGELYDSIEYKFDDIINVCVSEKYLALALQREPGPYLINVAEASLVHRFSYHSRTVAFNSKETHFVCDSGKTLYLFDLPQLVRRCTGEASDVPSRTVLWEDKKCFVVTKSKHLESITFDIVNKRSQRKNLMTDIDIRDMKLSNTGFALVIMTGKSLRMFSTFSEREMHLDNNLPPCCLSFPSSNYVNVSFSCDDTSLVAIRSSFVLIWKTETGRLTRILQTGQAPLLKLLTSFATNKAATLSEDNWVQIWDLNNIDYAVTHSNEIFSSPVSSVKVLHGKHQFVCFGSDSEDAKIVDSSSGQIRHILRDENDVGQVRELISSRDGNYIVTRMTPQSSKNQTSDKVILFDDVLWNVRNGSKIRCVFDSLFVAFSENCKTLVFVTSVNLSENWMNNAYNLETTALDSDFNFLCEFPERSEFLNTPCVVSQDEFSYIVGVVKSCESEKEIDGDVMTRLLVRGLFSPTATYRMIDIKGIVPSLDENNVFIDAFPYQDCSCLVVYAAKEDSKTLKSTPTGSHPKGAIIFNVEREECLHHFASFLEPTTDVSKITLSPNKQVILDDQGTVFTYDTKFQNPNKRLQNKKLKFPCLALEGQYVVGLSMDRSEVVVHRVSDGVQNAKIAVHGRGSSLTVGHDGRTIAVGCDDGRVMAWTLILHLSDPMIEVISKLPSRIYSREALTEKQGGELLESDINYISSRKMPNQNTSSLLDVRRPPSHQTVSTAVFLTQQSSLERETPCNVQ